MTNFPDITGAMSAGLAPHKAEDMLLMTQPADTSRAFFNIFQAPDGTWGVTRLPEWKSMASGLTEDQAALLAQGYRTFGPDKCLPHPGTRVIPRKADLITIPPPDPEDQGAQTITIEAKNSKKLVIFLIILGVLSVGLTLVSGVVAILK